MRRTATTDHVYHPQTTKGVSILCCNANLHFCQHKLSCKVVSTHSIALFIERDVSGIINLEDRVVRSVDVSQPLVHCVCFVQPPHIATRRINSTSAQNKSRSDSQCQIVPTPEEIPSIKEFLARIVSNKIIAGRSCP